jgi:TRAP-type uncharacterized transport system substrate-binding protein
MPPSSKASRARLIAIMVLALVGLGALGWLVGRRGALPPRTIVMATGPRGGGYAALAERYRRALASYGLGVELRSTQGDGENLALLQDPRSGISVAFLQSGSTSEEASPQLTSLGAMFLQPIWVFRRGEGPVVRLGHLEGKTISAGDERSGTRTVARRLLALAGIDAGSVNMVALAPEPAAQALVRGEIDAMVLASPWESPVVRKLVANPQVSLDGFPRANAFVALEPTLEKLVLPQGVGDMARDLPPRDVTLLALKVSLVVPRDLNPAIQYLLLEAASDIHGRPGIFHGAGQFPSAEGIDLPLSRDARHFYKSGRPFLQRYLPYWIAVLVERLLLVLIPVFGLMIPLIQFVPAIYNDMMQRRIIRLYGELKLLETEAAAPGGSGSRTDLSVRLDDLEARANHIHVPAKFALMRYTLKQHIELVRTRVAEPGGRGPRAIR